MPTYYDRYGSVKLNGEVKPVPGIVIEIASSDKKVIYKLGSTRLDKLSQEYYGNPYHGWLIMQANPQYGGLEFLIPDREVIRVPFPFESAIERYKNALGKNLRLYGE